MGSIFCVQGELLWNVGKREKKESVGSRTIRTNSV